LIEGNKLRLTGSMPIQTVKALQATDLSITNQPFTKDWAVEMTVISDKKSGLQNYTKGKALASQMGHSIVAQEQRHGLLKVTSCSHE